MNYDFDKDDEVLDIADSVHEERDRDVQLGKKIASEKKYHALVGSSRKVTPLDEDSVTSKPDNYASNAEAIIGRNLSEENKEQCAKIIAVVEQASPINVKDNQAKQQRQAAYTDAMQDWDTKLTRRGKARRAFSISIPKRLASLSAFTKSMWPVRHPV
jgi:hypothetical protein